MNPFNNPFLSPSNTTAVNWQAQAKNVFSRHPMVMRLPASAIAQRLEVAREDLSAREEKAAALRELVGNLSAVGFISPGAGGDVQDIAQRYDAEWAMVKHLRLAVEGLERFLEQREKAA
jgi:hypothetical protein